MSKLPLFLILPLTLSGCFPMIFTGATGATFAVAKDRTLHETMDDVKLSAALRADLIKTGFRDIYTKINVEVIDGRVLYTGKVDKEEQILQAVEIAWKQKGVKEVVNELRVDPKSSKFDLVQYTRDTMINGQVKSKLFVTRSVKFVNYTIVTLDDVVYLFGIARSQEELETVADIAAKIKGVTRVVSHVKMKEFSSGNSAEIDASNNADDATDPR